MISKIAAAFIICLMACNPITDEKTENVVTTDTAFFYINGDSRQIEDPNILKAVVAEASRLFTQADDFYYKAISQSDIDEFKEKGCFEVIFASPRELVILAVEETRIVSKLLIPLSNPYCTPDAHIVYGNPEYDSFNLLLNSQGCETLRKLVDTQNK